MASHLIKSMTGFGSADSIVGTSRIAVEIRSVNHRFFSPSIKTPSGLARIEGDIRELLRQRIARGHVTASVRVGSDGEAGPKIDAARSNGGDPLPHTPSSSPLFSRSSDPRNR